MSSTAPANRFNFTMERLHAIAPPATGRATYHDLDTAGLQLRVTAAGIKTFSLFRRIQGRVERVTLGRFPSMTVDTARKAALKIAAGIADGANPAQAKRAHRAAPTLREVLDDYLKHKRKRKTGAALAERTKAEYQDILTTHLMHWADKPLNAITPEGFRQFHRRLGERAPYAANRVRALLNALFNYAATNGLHTLTGEHPIRSTLPFPETSRERYALPRELPALLDAIEQSPLRDFFLLAILTGARKSNLQTMQWRDVDLVEAVWTIPKTKNGQPLSLPLVPEAVAVLQQRRAAQPVGPWVFPGDGATGHLVEPKTSWALILKRAGVENLRIHDLRRTLGTYQARSGASLHLIGKTLGHLTSASTQVYARLDLDPVRQSVNTATQAILAAAGRTDPAEVIPLPVKKKG